MSNVLTKVENKKPAATVTKPNTCNSNEEPVDDFPNDDVDAILKSIEHFENYETVTIKQPTNKPNTPPVSDNTSTAMCTLNRSLGLGNTLFSGARFNGGTFNVNITLQPN